MDTESVKAPCSFCTGWRSHNILFTETVDHPRDDPDWVSPPKTTYNLLKCCGCGAVVLCVAPHYFQINTFGPRNAPEYRQTDEPDFYPSIFIRKAPWWVEKMETDAFRDPAILELLEDIYKAFNAGAELVTVMGVRAVQEQLLVEIRGKPKTFSEGVKYLVEEGFLTSRDQKLMTEVRTLGNKVVHEAHTPSSYDCHRILDIIERVIEQLIIEPYLEQMKSNQNEAQGKE